MKTNIQKIKQNILAFSDLNDVINKNQTPKIIKSLDFIPEKLSKLSKIPQENLKQLFDINTGYTTLPLFTNSKERRFLSDILFNLINAGDIAEVNNWVEITDPEKLPIAQKLINLSSDISKISQKIEDNNNIKYKLFIMTQPFEHHIYRDDSLFSIWFSSTTNLKVAKRNDTEKVLVQDNHVISKTMQMVNYFPISDKELEGIDDDCKSKLLSLQQDINSKMQNISQNDCLILDGSKSDNGGVWHSFNYEENNTKNKEELLFGLIAYK